MLQKLGFAPGFNKQVTETGAEGQWFDGDNVRFRYGSPEKIGGWDQLGANKLTGAARALHHFDNNAGIKYAAIGTNRVLYIYSGGEYYDITPIRTAITGCKFSSSSGTPTVTIIFPSAHGMIEDDLVFFDDVTGLSSSTFNNASFEEKTFMATSVPSSTTITVTMPTNESGTPLSNSGDATGNIYFRIGPSQQLGGFGFGTGLYGGTVSGIATTTLATALTNTTGTTVVLASSSAFPASGEIRIDNEDISYTTNDQATGTLSGGARGVNGTTKATHSQNATVSNISNFVAWGESTSADVGVTLNPGLWVLDNFGTKLIALIYNGECFQWDSAPTNATSVRATLIPNAPTASRHVLVSTPDRHLVFFGTETTIGDKNTQDDMFIRFSSQENIEEYTVKAENTAGTQRLAAGSKIMGAIKGRDALYVWTDTSLFLMRFVGQPFTFSFEQAGTNCGLIGKNACVEVDGTAYWMSENGFFAYDGQLQSLPCLVEDFVYDSINVDARDLINCGLNNLYTEINWFYCNLGSDVVDSAVTYNYLESSAKRPVWTISKMGLGTNSAGQQNTKIGIPRAAWQDSAVFKNPHACFYDKTDNTSYDVIGNTDGSTVYYEHEVGTDQVNAGGVTTPIIAKITSGDFDITQKKSSTGQASVGTPDLRGDGEYIAKINRIIPDFIEQTGDTRVSLVTRDYPNNTSITTSFDIKKTQTKQDVRIRARAIALEVSNIAVSQDWKLGTFRLDIQPDGRRG